MKPIILWGCLLLSINAQSQELNTMDGQLAIGSKVPEVELKGIFNSNDSILNLSEFKGKLVIFDFWNLQCFACIEAFAKIDSLQKRFGDKIQIVAVNKESLEATKAFFIKRKKLKIPAIPFATGDTILSRMFPYVFVPHHVWIDSNSNVRFITNGWNLNEKNIEGFLNGSELQMSEKKYVKSFFIDKPLFAAENGKYLNTIDYYSLIGHCISGITIQNGVFNTNGRSDNPNRISQGCFTPIQLFRTAFSENRKYNLEARNSILFENLDTSIFIAPSLDSYDYDKWQAENLYNYDLVLPESRSHQLFKTMQQDLMSYFDVTARIEKRKVFCYVLVRNSKIDKIKSLGTQSLKVHRGKATDSLFYIHDIPIKQFVDFLSESFADNGIREPFIDGTNYKWNIDIGIRKSVVVPIVPDNLNKYLEAYDLQIVKRSEFVNVLVIRSRYPLKKEE